MLSKFLQNFLEKNKIKYELIEHKTVYTAFDKAATLKLKPAMIAKTIVVSLDGKDHALGLIPANKKLNKKKVLAEINKVSKKANLKIYKKIDFAKEKWMQNTFKGIKVGATPPFGLLYNLPFFVDNSLVKLPKIIINGGIYELSIKISPFSLLKLNPAPLKGSFSQSKK